MLLLSPRTPLAGRIFFANLRSPRVPSAGSLCVQNQRAVCNGAVFFGYFRHAIGMFCIWKILGLTLTNSTLSPSSILIFSLFSLLCPSPPLLPGRLTYLKIFHPRDRFGVPQNRYNIHSAYFNGCNPLRLYLV
jgi:hypothetical protein